MTSTISMPVDPRMGGEKLNCDQLWVTVDSIPFKYIYFPIPNKISVLI
jgi:hypothetical protein